MTTPIIAGSPEANVDDPLIGVLLSLDTPLMKQLIMKYQGIMLPNDRNEKTIPTITTATYNHSLMKH